MITTLRLDFGEADGLIVRVRASIAGDPARWDLYKAALFRDELEAIMANAAHRVAVTAIPEDSALLERYSPRELLDITCPTPERWMMELAARTQGPDGPAAAWLRGSRWRPTPSAAAPQQLQQTRPVARPTLATMPARPSLSLVAG